MALTIALVLAAAAGMSAAEPMVSVGNRVLAAQPGNTLTLEVGSQTSFTAVDRDHIAGRAVYSGAWRASQFSSPQWR